MARSLEAHLAECEGLLATVLTRVEKLGPEAVAATVSDALGRVTAISIPSPVALPRFDNSQMDGYAVASGDFAQAAQGGVTLSVARMVAAGDAPVTHSSGAATPIMTGAPVPDGADAIVPIEQADPPFFHRQATHSADTSKISTPPQVTFHSRVMPGQFVRPRGVDVEQGDELLPAQKRITPAAIGLLAAAGVREVAVRRRVRVLVVTTGHELVTGDASVGASVGAGKIVDSNGPMLEAALREAGADVVRVQVDDNAHNLLTVVQQQAASLDLVVTSGGISAGAFEVVKDAFTPLGMSFEPVAMQPGGPQGIGELRLEGRHDPLPVLAFPGNPVSTMLSAELFLLPTLRAYAGYPTQRHSAMLPLAEDVTSPQGKHQIRRARILTDGAVAVSPPGSHLLRDYVTATAYAHIPVGVSALRAGETVETWRLNV